MSDTANREERDLLGVKLVPKNAYYGVQTARALENFNISGVELRLYPDLITALAMVKLAAASANFDCGQFSREILNGIEAACLELIDGKLHDEFRLDVLWFYKRNITLSLDSKDFRRTDAVSTIDFDLPAAP